MVQGLRRCQGSTATLLTVGGLTEQDRAFFTGEPMWLSNGTLTTIHPVGYYRTVDAYTGALRWIHEADLVGVWETNGFW